MTDTPSTAPIAPTTAEGFLADRESVWNGVTRASTYVVAFIVLLLAFLWWWLV